MSEKRIDEAAGRLAERLISGGFGIEAFCKALHEVGTAWADAYGLDVDEIEAETKR